MAAGDTVRDHQERCAPHLARLQMLAGGPGETPLRNCAMSQIIEAIGAILAEVRAAGSSQFAVADSPGRGSPGHIPLLTVRLTRLEHAARQMVDAAAADQASAEVIGRQRHAGCCPGPIGSQRLDFLVGHLFGNVAGVGADQMQIDAGVGAMKRAQIT